jgi:hypothetical protein
VQILPKESPLNQQGSTASSHPDPSKTPFSQAQTPNIGVTPVTTYSSTAKLLKPWQLNQYEQHSNALKKAIEPELDAFHRILHVKIESRIKLQTLSQ